MCVSDDTNTICVSLRIRFGSISFQQFEQQLFQQKQLKYLRKSTSKNVDNANKRKCFNIRRKSIIRVVSTIYVYVPFRLGW